jgi:aspartokinase
MNNQTVSNNAFSQSQIAETDFEKRRGISQVEVRPGLTQVHVVELEEPISKSRVRVLDAVASAGISLDFLKLTPKGLSFIVPSNKTEAIKETLEKNSFKAELAIDRSIVLVHAVNMRDEEGMIAGIVRRAISTGIPIDHVTDMHDRMLIVTKSVYAEQFSAELAKEIVNV